MSDIAIRVEGLSKAYQIRHSQARSSYRTLREDLIALARRPLSGGDKQSREQFWALDDVSFDVKHGEALGIIGRNGAGKSTLLQILSRITKPTKGTATVYGRVGSLLEVGTGFHPELTGRENIYLNGAILGMTKRDIQRHFDEIVAFAEIDQFLDTPVKRYSSGMYMRLAFAVAAHLEPEVLVVDEVLAVGDAAFQKKCLGKMSEVAQGGRTVLFVSHNMAAVQQLCERAVLLEHGQITNSGSATGVVQRYLSYAADGDALVLIDSKDHILGGDRIRVKSVELLEPANQSFAVYWQKSIRLELQVEVYESIQRIDFGLGIIALDGTPILTVHHTDNGGAPVDLEPGNYRIGIDLNNPLRLGVYGLVVGAHETIAKTSLFYIPNRIRFEVLPPQESSIAYSDNNAGLINGQSRWDFPAILNSRAQFTSGIPHRVFD